MPHHRGDIPRPRADAGPCPRTGSDRPDCRQGGNRYHPVKRRPPAQPLSIFSRRQTAERRGYPNRLIDQWIVRSEAGVARFPQPSEEDVNRSIERLKRSFSSPEEFQSRQKLSGISDDEIRRFVRAQLYLSNYLDSRFRPSIQIDEPAIEEFYKNRVVPRAASRKQTPPTLDNARDFIQEALVQRAINEQADRWLKESRPRVRVELLLDENSK